MKQKDLDFISKFEKVKNRQGLRTIVILFFIALVCCSMYILWDVIKDGTVEVTLPYFIEKFSFSFLICFIANFFSYYDMNRKYKKLKEKE